MVALADGCSPVLIYCEKNLGRLPYGPKDSRNNCTKLLDRVDTSGDYTLDNVVPCCERCNVIKSRNKTGEQMLRLVAERDGRRDRLQQLTAGLTWQQIYAAWSRRWQA